MYTKLMTLGQSNDKLHCSFVCSVKSSVMSDIRNEVIKINNPIVPDKISLNNTTIRLSLYIVYIGGFLA
jgi:hypothetical protein